MIRFFSLPLLTLLIGLLINGEAPKYEYIEFDSLTYPEHLPGAFTGGFGEETCRNCHFDYEINPAGGDLSVRGLDEKVVKGKRIEIIISVERNDLGRAGFQISARYPDGTQAGQFKIDGNDRVTFTQAVPDSLQYVQHSKSGTKPIKSGKNSWTVLWQVPSSSRDTVIFNIAANAANGDRSAFGDFIYKREFVINLESSKHSYK